MGWRDLITDEEKTVVAPWMGGRSLHFGGRTWRLAGPLPSEHGWYQFAVQARTATLAGDAEPEPHALGGIRAGFLVGNRFVPDDAPAALLGNDWTSRYAIVRLVEPGLDRFARIEVGVTSPGGPFLFKGQAFPLGPEDEVLSAFLDKRSSITDIKGVIPSLQAAFELECFERDKADERRLVLERVRREEEAQAARDERRRQLADSLGTGAGRREMAAVDFHSAASAALAIGGATLLDVRPGRGSETVVRYRLDGRRYECVCDVQLRIIDAGVCLTDEDTGEKGDTFFTLESLPAVIKQADREGVLVVYRHV